LANRVVCKGRSISGAEGEYKRVGEILGKRCGGKTEDGRQTTEDGGMEYRSGFLNCVLMKRGKGFILGGKKAAVGVLYPPWAGIIIVFGRYANRCLSQGIS
jgi:hypothetical protein